MNKLLVFDGDASLAALGNKEDHVKLLGTAPISCPSLHKARDLFLNLFVVEKKPIEHEMFASFQSFTPTDDKEESKETLGTEVNLVLNEAAKKNGLSAIALDTWSQMATGSQGIITKTAHPKNPFITEVNRGVWSALKNVGATVLGIIQSVNVPVIVNCHYREEKGTSGPILVPDMASSLRNAIPRTFDFVFYADKLMLEGKEQYVWIIDGTGMTAETKIRFPAIKKHLLDEHGPTMRQDFKLLLKSCKGAGLLNPKILILGASGRGKSSALATINGFYPPKFEAQ